MFESSIHRSNKLFNHSALFDPFNIMSLSVKCMQSLFKIAGILLSIAFANQAKDNIATNSEITDIVSMINTVFTKIT